MHIIESTLTPNAKAALRIIRALRALPECAATIAAERRALKNINSKECTDIALILQAEEEVQRGQ